MSAATRRLSFYFLHFWTRFLGPAKMEEEMPPPPLRFGRLFFLWAGTIIFFFFFSFCHCFCPPQNKGRRLKVKTATKNKQRCIFLFFSYWRLLFFAALLFSLPANIFPFVLLPFVCFEFWPAIKRCRSLRLNASRLLRIHWWVTSRSEAKGEESEATGGSSD